jgi:hypothetical protein
VCVHLLLTATSGGIDLEGTTSDGPVRGSFVRRQPNALVGNYGSEDASAKMDIKSIADGRFTFSLTVQGKTLASGATAIQEGAPLVTLLAPGLFTRWYTSDAIPGCQLSPGRAKGKPYILFANDGDKIAIGRREDVGRQGWTNRVAIPVDLSAWSGITRIEIVDVKVLGGIGLDDFRFDLPD